MFLPLFHVLVITINLYTIWYDQKYVKVTFHEKIERQKLPFNNRILFLTMWGLTLQTIYFTVALLNDIFGTNARAPKKTSIIRLIKDALFSLAFPIALYIFITFWAIYLVDKDLIFPEAIAKVMPAWVNHVMHTAIAPFILIELLFSPREYPSRKTGLRLNVAFTLCYIVYLNYIYQVTDTFVYPVLNVMNWPLRILFFGMSTLVSICMYFLGESIDSVVNCPREVAKLKRR